MSDVNTVPEDSTLRRHYDTHQRMLTDSGGGAPARQAPRSAPAESPAESGHHHHASNGASGGGFMGWLKRVFGG